MRVLIVEDDPKLASAIRRGLAAHGYAADVTDRGEDALWMVVATSYGAIVLDLMLPGIDGVETCRRMRERGVATPVLALTARTAVADRVAVLDAGADDHLAKPFAFEELTARLRALARRTVPARSPEVVVGDLRLDPASREVRRGHVPIALSPKEFALLEVLMARPGQVLSRLQLLEHAWDAATEHRSNVIDVHVRTLREKIDRPFGIDSIETVRGAGYRLRDPAGR